MNENGFNNTRATIKDVAVKANVSLSTVSRALREPDKTPAETVSKVRAAAEALNYVYNATAGSLPMAPNVSTEAWLLRSMRSA